MNFFKLYIGDYQRDTAHLSITEHGAYVLMLQHYYATEKPLPTGKALHRMLRAQDKAERDAIDSVAEQFWKSTDDGLVNERADVEISKACAQGETNARIAREREARRKVQRERHEQSTNRATNDQPNQTPDTRLKPKDKTSSSTAQPLPGEIQPSDAATIPDPPTNPSHWLQWFNATQGLCLDPTSIHDRKKFWPLATEWCKAQVQIDQMQSAIAKARAESSEPIVFMPAYVDRIIATQNAPPPQRTAAAEGTLAAARTIFGDEHGYRSGTVIDGTAITLGGDGQEDFPRIAG